MAALAGGAQAVESAAMIRRADRRPRLVLAAAVVLAHSLLWWVWPRSGPAPPDATTAQQAPLIVRLLPRDTPAPVPPDATLAAPTAEPARIPPRSAVMREPATRATAVSTPEAATAAAPAASVTVAPALNITLPNAVAAPTQPTMKDQMFNDPRSNSAPKTVESRVASVAGTREWTEARMDATRTRFAKDGTCVEVHVARNAQIDPWNQSHSPTPKTVKPDCD